MEQNESDADLFFQLLQSCASQIHIRRSLTRNSTIWRSCNTFMIQFGTRNYMWRNHISGSCTLTTLLTIRHILSTIFWSSIQFFRFHSVSNVPQTKNPAEKVLIWQLEDTMMTAISQLVTIPKEDYTVSSNGRPNGTTIWSYKGTTSKEIQVEATKNKCSFSMHLAVFKTILPPTAHLWKWEIFY